MMLTISALRVQVTVADDETEDVAVRKFMKSVVQSNVINQVHKLAPISNRHHCMPAPMLLCQRLACTHCPSIGISPAQQHFIS
jgi:hypothetical protein